MKIIKEGKLPKNSKKLYTGMCRHCGCVVEAEDGDIIGRKDLLMWVKCPTEGCSGDICVLPKMEDERY